jgi:tetratricopeptide (TPR) repeat protein
MTCGLAGARPITHLPWHTFSGNALLHIWTQQSRRPVTQQRFMRLALLVIALLVLAATSDTHDRTKKKTKKRRAPKPKQADAAKVLAMSHHQRGVMAHVQGDIDGAKVAFRQAIAVKPDFAYAYHRLGFMIQEQQQARLPASKGHRAGRRRDDIAMKGGVVAEDPIPLFRAAIRIDGSDEMPYHALGQALKDQRRLDEAAHVLQTATLLNPRSEHERVEPVRAQCWCWGLRVVCVGTS